jgi:16S rRNA (guanine527-N7)-methyltransferase
MNESRIREWLAPYGIRAESQLCERISKYIALLLTWNTKISLTTVTDPEQIVRFHFGESLFVIKGEHVEKGRLADVGSGAGFPGLPLAMALPELHVTLIESNLKKAAFLSEVIRSLDLKTVTVARVRMESFDKSAASFDFIVARALGNYETLAEWAKDRLAPTGKVALWLGDEDASKLSGLKGWTWEHTTKIPNSRNRVILIGTPDLSN